MIRKFIPTILVFIFMFSFSFYIVQAQATGDCTFSDGSVETSYPEQLCEDEGGMWSPTNNKDTTGTGSRDSTNSGQKINTTIVNPLAKVGVNSISELLKVILNNIIIPIGGVVAVLAFIYSGFLYVMAQGNESAIEKAHRTLLYTAIGTAVLLGASVIMTVITNTVNQLK